MEREIRKSYAVFSYSILQSCKNETIHSLTKYALENFLDICVGQSPTNEQQGATQGSLNGLRMNWQ